MNSSVYLISMKFIKYEVVLKVIVHLVYDFIFRVDENLYCIHY